MLDLNRSQGHRVFQKQGTTCIEGYPHIKIGQLYKLKEGTLQAIL